jgi:uncharacterized repeat protein (TIGR03837 family)
MVQSPVVDPSPPSVERIPRWDIFCSVVDNFGDAGVAWRLARQLAGEYGVDVTLFIDNVAALARIAPGVSADADRQHANGVTVVLWPTPRAAFASSLRPADVVVELFGCGLPAPYLQAMAERPRAPTWIVLEYLSAEPWIDGCHGLPSRHPRLPLDRYFYFPGFTGGSGGLLRERDLFARRDSFAIHPDGRQLLWRKLQVPALHPDALVVSLFCYPSPAIARLLDAWSEGAQEMACIVPDGVATDALTAWGRGALPRPGKASRRGRLQVHSVPFVSQDDYDRLLWSCNFNFVRGEDSFVRAQWAARPLLWHAYPQADAVHMAKLAAFLARYCSGLPLSATAALRGFTEAWNDGAGDPERPAALWPALRACGDTLDAHARAWARRLASGDDLAAGLVKFVLARV